MDVIVDEKQLFTSAQKILFSLPLLQHQLISESIDNDTENYQLQEIYRIHFLA